MVVLKFQIVVLCQPVEVVAQVCLFDEIVGWLPVHFDKMKKLKLGIGFY
jgi:hypothetical protein